MAKKKMNWQEGDKIWVECLTQRDGYAEIDAVGKPDPDEGTVIVRFKGPVGYLYFLPLEMEEGQCPTCNKVNDCWHEPPVLMPRDDDGMIQL